MSGGGTIPRSTALKAHDNVVAALPGNLDVLISLPCISAIRIWDRELDLLFDRNVDEGHPSERLTGYWNSPWSKSEMDAICRQLDMLRQDETLWALDQGTVLEELVQRVEKVRKSIDKARDDLG